MSSLTSFSHAFRARPSATLTGGERFALPGGVASRHGRASRSPLPDPWQASLHSVRTSCMMLCIIAASLPRRPLSAQGRLPRVAPSQTCLGGGLSHKPSAERRAYDKERPVRLKPVEPRALRCSLVSLAADRSSLFRRLVARVFARSPAVFRKSQVGHIGFGPIRPAKERGYFIDPLPSPSFPHEERSPCANFANAGFQRRENSL